MERQLRFKRQGDSMVCVNESTGVTPPPNKKKTIIVSSIIIAALGLVILFFIDGGIGLLSAGIVEVIKKASRFR
jgi:hypothetical protein